MRWQWKIFAFSRRQQTLKPFSIPYGDRLHMATTIVINDSVASSHPSVRWYTNVRKLAPLELDL